jgi:hypothetical protein
METGRAPQQAKGGDHTDESETVVTMQMGDKHMTEFRETHPAFTQLHLRAFCTIEHQNLIAHLDHL